MARRNPRTEQVLATISLGGQNFPFRLHTRPIPLGSHGTVQYYWMDLGDLRRAGRSANVRNCIAHWWAAMQSNRGHNVYCNEFHYVLANCYPMISQNRSLQSIYRDAFLDPRSRPHVQVSVPEETRTRLRDIVQGRDWYAVRDELDRTLNWFVPSEAELPALQDHFENTVHEGIDVWRHGGSDGLRRYMEDLGARMQRTRRRGGQTRARTFLNMFAYEAKISFYLCYANTWVDLVPWLRQHRSLDDLGARFLRLWHHQEQPVEIADVSSAQDPGLTMTVTATTNLDRVRDPTPQDTSYERGVFSGQVLGLHPISGILMQDPAFLEIAGRFFASDEFFQVDNRGPIDRCPAYWELIRVILYAAHEYRLTAHQIVANRPATTRRRRDKVTEQVRQPELRPDTDILEDYATDRDLRCEACGGPLRLVRYHHANSDETSFRADFECHACSRAEIHLIDREDFEAWFRNPEPK